MRLLFLSLACLLVGQACTGPHSTGALWAQQELDLESQRYKVTDAQRADQWRAFEVGQADIDLSDEQARIVTALDDCPGTVRQPLTVSVGDRIRDTIRLRDAGDPARLAQVAQVALADWRLRRALASGNAQFCGGARLALGRPLNSAVPTPVPATVDMLAQLGLATVSRDPAHAVAPPASVASWSVDQTVSSYALGYVDAVQAPAPLPQYLAAVYGGVIVGQPATLPLNGETPESMVDRLAPAYPQWEPDALYVVLSGT